jgi:mono/diheme cytochrome c family protein
MKNSQVLGSALVACLSASGLLTASSLDRAAVAGDAAHGRYLVEHVAMCIECHTPRDGAGQLIATRLYCGAPIPVAPPPWNEPWASFAPRIRGLRGYDDAQAMQLLTQGAIGRTGLPLKPPMPAFRMTPQDAADTIAFLRSQE